MWHRFQERERPMSTRYPSTIERFWASVDLWDPDHCWLWTGGTHAGGYGRIMHEGRLVRAHRFAYEHFRDPIPDGLQLDHLCRVRHCVNPKHLEVVSAKDNLRRGYGVAGTHRRQTHCKRGHEFTPENTYREPSRPGSRSCRKCQRQRAISRWRTGPEIKPQCERCGRTIRACNMARHLALCGEVWK